MTDFIAKKIKSSFVQHLNATPDRVFPLLSPDRKNEWNKSWQYELLFSETTLPGNHSIFRAGNPGEHKGNGYSTEPNLDVWMITRYEINRRIEFVRTNIHYVSSLSFTLVDNGDGTTRFIADQLLVGVTETGNKTLNAIAKKFLYDFSIGEVLLNHFLTTGERLSMLEATESAMNPY